MCLHAWGPGLGPQDQEKKILWYESWALVSPQPHTKAVPNGQEWDSRLPSQTALLKRWLSHLIVGQNFQNLTCYYFIIHQLLKSRQYWLCWWQNQLRNKHSFCLLNQKESIVGCVPFPSSIRDCLKVSIKRCISQFAVITICLQSNIMLLCFRE